MATENQKKRVRARYFTRIGVPGLAKAAIAGGGEQEAHSVPTAVGGGDVTRRNTSVWTETEMVNNRPTPDRLEEVHPEEFPHAEVDLGHGDVLIAAITSCTNTSNPSVMLAAGLLAKKAVERGLTVRPAVKNSLAPGSRVVTEYLQKTGLQDLPRSAWLQSRRLRMHYLYRQLRPARSDDRTGCH